MLSVIIMGVITLILKDVITKHIKDIDILYPDSFASIKLRMVSNMTMLSFMVVFITQPNIVMRFANIIATIFTIIILIISFKVVAETNDVSSGVHSIKQRNNVMQFITMFMVGYTLIMYSIYHAVGPLTALKELLT